MRIYISGKISGLPYKEAEQRFEDAEALLTELGFEVINPLKNGHGERISQSVSTSFCACDNDTRISFGQIPPHACATW